MFFDKLKTFEVDEKFSGYNYAIIKTSKGDMRVKFLKDEAPQAVINFATLANDGFYNGLNFHRVIPNFVIQGGCPNGDGRGGPGYRIKCECKNQKSKHKKGSLSMAHAGPDTGGSQFFICHSPQPHLDGVHTIFGELIDDESKAVLDQIRAKDEIVSVEILNEIV